MNKDQIWEIVKRGEGKMKYVNCPECDKKIRIKKKGTGRCRCGVHVKYLNE